MQNFSDIREFLNNVDKTFSVPLSERRDLDELAKKFYDKAECFCKKENGQIVSALFGYTKNTVNNMAYISVVATLNEYRHKGYAKELLQSFIERCKILGLSAIHLYTTKKTKSFYLGFGFKDYFPENEPRKNDEHLILLLKEE